MKQPNKKPVGRPRVETEVYFRRIHPKLVQPMDDHLKKLKAEFINEIEVKE
jgi:hypothetical protein